ncbi:AAA family ATPase, partial [Escherichia coli]|nr:AAA family ATPase [Escherichia coli]
EILSKFESKENHKLIILTGTAGDGKTKLCRDIVEALDGDEFDESAWNENSYFSTEERTVVKDFSELKNEKTRVIQELITILDSQVVPKPILIAVNDGILVEEIENFINSTLVDAEKVSARKLKEIIEDKINLGFSQCEGQEVINLINLSKLNAKDNIS